MGRGLLEKEPFVAYTRVTEINVFNRSKTQRMKVPSDHISYYSLLYHSSARDLSILMKIQDPFLYRGLSRARTLAYQLIDDKGVFEHGQLKTFLQEFKKNLYTPYPNSPSDSSIFEHELRVLTHLFKTKENFRAFRMPVSSHYVEMLIFYSLGLSSRTPLTDADLRRAVLSALLNPVRQNIGSCFATAPAIYIQSEQIENFLADLESLIMTGSMTRVISGNEYTVPLSPSWGIGELKRKVIPSNVQDSPGLRLALGDEIEKLSTMSEVITVEALIDQLITDEKKAADAKCLFKSLTDHALLKAWEFTIASFSDYKVNFFKWNLYASLGFDPLEEHGIGSVIHQDLEQSLDESNKKIEKLNKDCQIEHDQVLVTQALLRQASSSDRISRLKVELEMKLHALYMSKDKRDEVYKRTEKLSKLFSLILEEYSSLIQEYFQEIYDTEMAIIDPNLYADSPAGFRLVYKHGRRDPSLWTLISNEKEYQQCLHNFFLITEPLIIDKCEFEEEVQKLITRVMHHIQTPEFMKSATQRLQRWHCKQKMHQGKKTPWSYLSGGMMNTLLRGYYTLEDPVTEATYIPETPMDLMVFILDTLKEQPYTLTKRFEENPNDSLFMFSPSHAFLLKPGLFLDGWVHSNFSYTWARDHALHPSQCFYNNISLTPDDQRLLFDLWGFEHSSPADHAISVKEFYNLLGPDQEKANVFLRYSLPLIPAEELTIHANAVLREAGLDSNKVLKEIDNLNPILNITSKSFRDLLLSAIIRAHNTLTFREDIYKTLMTAMQKLKLAVPAPFIFADTNWSKFMFAFLVNPGTNDLELWRTDRLGEEAYPMTTWKRHFRDKPWGILTTTFKDKQHRDSALLNLSKKV